MTYASPVLDLEDSVVLEEIAAMRTELAEHWRAPRRWTGQLRGTALARAIHGSNSIEEWLGANTDDYHRVLAATGHGAWAPDGDAHLWVTFNLRAHHLQAQTVRRLWHSAQKSYVLDDAAMAHGLPERVVDPLYTALLGFPLRRPTYVEQAGIDPQTAGRDFKALSERGLSLLAPRNPLGATTAHSRVEGGYARPVMPLSRAMFA